jgi:hypothetical protein
MKSQDQVADIFTKLLKAEIFHKGVCFELRNQVHGGVLVIRLDLVILISNLF